MRQIIYTLIILVSFIGGNNGAIWDDIWNDVHGTYQDAAEIVRYVRELKGMAISTAVDNSVIDTAEIVTFVRVLKNLDIQKAVDNSVLDIPEIVRFVRNFNIKPEDIVMIANGVNKLVTEDIPYITLNIANKTLFKIKERVDSDVASLSNTLKTCLTNIKQIASDYGILDEQSNLAQELDVTPTLFEELATFLILYKAQIEFVCNGKATELITIFVNMMKQSAGNSGGAPASPQKECDIDGYCKPIKPSYPWGAYYDLLAFPLTVDLFAGDDIPAVIPDKTSYTDSNSFAQLKFIVGILKEMDYWIDNICEIFDGCTDPINIVKCASVSICTVIHKPFGTLVHFVEYLLEIAEMHDGMIETAQINTLFIDRENIIDNQFALRNEMRQRLTSIETYLGVTPKKTVSLDVNNPIIDGVSVQLITDTVRNNNQWEITGSVQNSWQMLVSLDNKWGISDTKKSILTFKMFGTSPISGADSDLVLAFSVDSKQYWSGIFNMDNVFKNNIGPKCDTSMNPTASLSSGDINAIVMNNGGARSDNAATNWDTWKPEYPNNSGDDNAWPMIFQIINDPVSNKMFVSVTNTQRLDVQKCGFGESFASFKGLDIYIGVDGNGEQISIEKFQIELELAQSDVASSNVNIGINNDISERIYIIFGVIFLISLVICNISIYMMMKLKYENQRVPYKTVSHYNESETEIEN